MRFTPCLSNTRQIAPPDRARPSANHPVFAAFARPVGAISVLAGLFVGGSGLAEPALDLPIDCRAGVDCIVQNYVDHDPSDGARDYACGTLAYDAHTGTDFRLPTIAAMRRGVAVLAALPGRVQAVRDGMADISADRANASEIDGRECGNGVLLAHDDGWQTQYCHLKMGSVAVTVGQRVSAGDRLGEVGLSGRTVFPHLEFVVRRQGRAVDPFVGDIVGWNCREPRRALWHPAVAAALAYKARFVLNAGFADGPVTMDAIEQGLADQSPPNATAPALVYWVRIVGLRAGDEASLKLIGPDGGVIVASDEPPSPKARAQQMWFTGRRLRGEAWPTGRYTGRFELKRDGETVLADERRIFIR